MRYIAICVLAFAIAAIAVFEIHGAIQSYMLAGICDNPNVLYDYRLGFCEKNLEYLK